MAKTPFLGPSYSSRSPNLAHARAINLFAEVVEAPKGTGSEVGGFYSRPGWGAPTFTCGTGPTRAMLPTDFGLFVVSGNQVWMVAPSGGQTMIGSLATYVGPVSVVANKTQAAFFDATGGWSWSGGVFSAIDLPFPNPGTAVYQDGFALINQLGTFVVWQSNLNDLTTWDPLNFDTEDGQPDNIVALAELHRQVVILKEENLAFWINAGNPGFAFQRLEGVYPARGIVAAQSVALCGDVLCWVGGGENGEVCVYTMGGYSADRISTFAIDYQINKYATATDAVGFSLLIEGHTFYVVSFPTGNRTWVLDLSTTQKIGSPMWFEWLAFSNGQYSRWAANCQAVWQGQNLIGDYQSGNIYALNMDMLTDNGGIRKCLRSWRHLPEDAFQTSKLNYLDIACDTGLQVPPGTNPQLVFEQSFDGGQTWTSQQFRSVGATGETAQDVRFNRLGATRRGLNSDRILEISTTDQWKIGWLGADAG